MLIQLTQNQTAIIDDEDADIVLQFKWQAVWKKHTKSFVASANTPMISGKRERISMHRLIMGLEKGDKFQVDHKNHNTLDNQKDNLRIVTNRQNQQNRPSSKGYYFNKSRNKWMARITNNYETKFLGRFNTELEAQQACSNAKKAYGWIDE